MPNIDHHRPPSRPTLALSPIYLYDDWQITATIETLLRFGDDILATFCRTAALVQ